MSGYKKERKAEKPMTMERLCLRVWNVFLICVVSFYVVLPAMQVVTGSTLGLVIGAVISVMFVRLYITEQTDLLGYQRKKEKYRK